MDNYYEDKLNSQSLFKVYETAIPRVHQYLDSEIEFVRQRLHASDNVLEMAAGYGRIIKKLAPFCKSITGIDISAENVSLGAEYLRDYPNASMVTMDAHKMDIEERFDVVLCLQNALSAMRANSTLIQNTIDLLIPGGTLYISTYSANFWDWRLKWFEEQAQKGLLGEIDYEQTKDGVIICKDGFRATTHSREDLDKIGASSNFPYRIEEVDQSSLFLIIEKK